MSRFHKCGCGWKLPLMTFIASPLPGTAQAAPVDWELEVTLVCPKCGNQFRRKEPFRDLVSAVAAEIETMQGASPAQKPS